MTNSWPVWNKVGSVCLLPPLPSFSTAPAFQFQSQTVVRLIFDKTTLAHSDQLQCLPGHTHCSLNDRKCVGQTDTSQCPLSKKSCDTVFSQRYAQCELMRVCRLEGSNRTVARWLWTATTFGNSLATKGCHNILIVWDT